MATVRQNKISELIKRELSTIFQQNSGRVSKGAMVTVTIIRVSKDLSVAKAYLSIFGVKDIQDSFKEIQKHKSFIKNELAKKVKNQLRKTPDFQFFIDDSLDYAMNIDKLLK